VPAQLRRLPTPKIHLRAKQKAKVGKITFIFKKKDEEFGKTHFLQE